tara:strand:+ start:961 stop:1884 length:924 start_codon:yes stop_codon:yes gene_type:complete
VPAAFRGGIMIMRRVFKEPTKLSLLGATFLAFFEILNSAGYSDNVAFKAGLIDQTTPGKEKLVIPEGLSSDIWGGMQIGLLDYAIVLFLAYTSMALWAHRPRDYLSQKRSQKIVAIKSIGWIRAGFLSLLVGLLSTANKNGYFADLVFNVTGEKTEGALGRIDGSWGFQPMEWGFLDYLELILLYSLFIFAIWKGTEVDKAKLNPIPDNRNFIERIWGGIKDAERDQRTEIEVGASKANTAFTSLVNLLGAAVSLNVAASSLDEGNVKSAFNKWKNLTHSKGKQHKHWGGLSESLDQAGNFAKEEEE